MAEQLVKRIHILNVPLDSVEPDSLPALIRALIDSNQPQNIVLLSVWDLLRARRKGAYRSFVENAGLVIPISASLIRGVRFLTGFRAHRYSPFDFIITLLTTIDDRDQRLYLLGGKSRLLYTVERNIRQTFPHISIVGRHTSDIKKHEENLLLQSIKRASPTLVLVGKGVRGREKWLAHHAEKLGPGLRLWGSDIYEVFAKKAGKPGRFLYKHGLEWLYYLFQKSWYFFRFFSFIRYNILLLVYKLFMRKNNDVDGSA
ncbi:UDP-N-acetyl-D-mannosamine transferase [Spirochaetia bacterium]|nr:UDP-N-acetyl-D-mannosamine transferase [Spirochaetia bacterium]